MLNSLDCDDLLRIPVSDNSSCPDARRSELLELVDSLEPVIRFDLMESAVPLEVIIPLGEISSLESDLPINSSTPSEYSDLVKSVNPDFSTDPVTSSVLSRSNMYSHLPESSADLVLHSRFQSHSMGLAESEDSIDVELRIDPDFHPFVLPDEF